jgi:translation initiation factor 2 beta subunit (eIF-2beta)/eIF-5
MVANGDRITGAIANFAQKFPNDPAALEEERVNAEVRKAHSLLFGPDLGFGGIRHLTKHLILEDFVREAVENIAHSSDTICFVQTKFQQEIIQQCDYLFGDISYKLCRQYYKMVITGYSHVTHKGVVVATAFLERTDAAAYATFFKALFRNNPSLITVAAQVVTLNYEALAVDFSDAQRKGLIAAVIALARQGGCRLGNDEIEKIVLLKLKGCAFHFQQSVRKVSQSGALSDNAYKAVFAHHVEAWVNCKTMKEFHCRKADISTHFPKIKGWLDWWSLPVHAVLIFPSVRKEMLEETDEMYDKLPTTNNNSEGTNSMESHLCKHNVELVPAIMDSYRVTIRQQRQHEGIASGQVKHKNSPNQHPVCTGRRRAVEDFDRRCPERADASRKRTRAVSPSKSAKKGKPSLLKSHTDKDRVARVNALIANPKATVGFFAEAFPDQAEVKHPDERWFMQVTRTKITDNALQGKWCLVNSLDLSDDPECALQLNLVKDYAERSVFV